MDGVEENVMFLKEQVNNSFSPLWLYFHSMPIDFIFSFLPFDKKENSILSDDWSWLSPRTTVNTTTIVDIDEDGSDFQLYSEVIKSYIKQEL